MKFIFTCSTICLKWVIVFLFLLSTTARSQDVSLCGSDAVSIHGSLKIRDGKLHNERDSVISMAGMSFAPTNTISAPDVLYSTATVENFANFALMRVPLGVDQPGGYLTDPQTNIDRVTTAVDGAIEKGAYIIISWYSQQAHNFRSEAISFFQLMAQRYGDTPNVLYEIYSDPGSASWSQVVKPYATEVIRAIRTIDADNIIIVGTPHDCSQVLLIDDDPINSLNVAYSFRFHAGTQGMQSRENVKAALGRGLYVFATEYSAFSEDLMGTPDENAHTAWNNFMAYNDISSTYWALGADQSGASALELTTTRSFVMTDEGRRVQRIISRWNTYCPTVEQYTNMTYPQFNETFFEGDIVRIGLVTDETNGPVDFYVDGSRVDTDNAPPYNSSWIAKGTGSHQIEVRESGRTLHGSTIHVTSCYNSFNDDLYWIAHPQSFDSIFQSEVIEILVENYFATNNNENVQINFYVDNVWIGSDNTPPYQVTYSTDIIGSHWVSTELITNGNTLSQAGQSFTVYDNNTRGYPNGIPHRLPGTINATDFNTGGQGVGYFDTDVAHQGNGPRQNTRVDTEYLLPYGNIAYVASGEWLSYLVRLEPDDYVPKNYDIHFEVSSAEEGGKFHLELDGQPITCSIDVPNTGGWSNFTTISYKGVALPGRLHTLRLVFDGGRFNISRLIFDRAQCYNNDLTAVAPDGSLIDDGSLPFCSFSTPRTNSLPTTIQTYHYVYVLGEGGPDLSHVIVSSINWDLQNNGIYQFSFNLDNGIPTWWLDLIPHATVRFNRPQPDVSLFNTGIPGLDGNYWVTVQGNDLVLVSKTNTFAIYFSHQNTPPICVGARTTLLARMDQGEWVGEASFTMYPNPGQDILTIEIFDVENTKQVSLVDMTGKVLIDQTSISKRIKLNLHTLANGMYVVRVLSKGNLQTQKFIKID